MGNKNKYNPRKVEIKELKNFKGVIDPDGHFNAPDAYVSNSENLPSKRIREMAVRAGQTFEVSYDGGINTGTLGIVARVVGEGTNLHAEAIIPLAIFSPPEYNPPTVPDKPPIIDPEPPLEYDLHPAEWCRFLCSNAFGSIYVSNTYGAGTETGTPMEYDVGSKVWSIGDEPLTTAEAYTAMDQHEFWAGIQTRVSRYELYVKRTATEEFQTGTNNWGSVFYTSQLELFQNAGGSVYESSSVYGFKRYIAGVYVGRGIMQAGDDTGAHLYKDVLRVLTTHNRVGGNFSGSLMTKAEEGVAVLTVDNMYLDEHITKVNAYVIGSRSTKYIDTHGTVDDITLADRYFRYVDTSMDWGHLAIDTVRNNETGITYENVYKSGDDAFSIRSQEQVIDVGTQYKITFTNGTSSYGYVDSITAASWLWSTAKYYDNGAGWTANEYTNGDIQKRGDTGDWEKISYNAVDYFKISLSTQKFSINDQFSIKKPYTTYASIPAPEFGSNVSIATTTWADTIATGITVHKISQAIASKNIDFPFDLLTLTDVSREFTMGMVTTLNLPIPPADFIG